MKTAFCLIESVLYLITVIMDLEKLDSIPYKYALLAVCVLYGIYRLFREKDRISLLVLIIRVLTAIADWFLLVRVDHYLTGVILFCAAESLYALLVASRKSWILRAAIWLSAGILLMLFREFSPLYLAAAYSIIWLSFNVIDAFKNRQMAAGIGFLLFWICDILVGLFNLGVWTSFTANGNWLFYGPSQIILTAGSYEHEKK